MTPQCHTTALLAAVQLRCPATPTANGHVLAGLKGLPEEGETPVDERSHSFVVRVWEERHDETGGEGHIWRGCLEEVRSGTRVYFSTLLELCDHLERRTGMVSPRENWHGRLLARSRHWRTGGHRPE